MVGDAQLLRRRNHHRMWGLCHYASRPASRKSRPWRSRVGVAAIAWVMRPHHPVEPRYRCCLRVVPEAVWPARIYTQ